MKEIWVLTTEIYLKGYYFSDSQAVVLTKMPVITD